MTTVSKNTKLFVIALSVFVVAIPVVFAHAQDAGYDYGDDGSSYDSGYDYGGDSYDTGYDSGDDYDTGYDYGDDTSYDTGYDSGDDYDTGYDYGDDTYSDFPSDTYSEFPSDCSSSDCSSYSEFPSDTYSEFPSAYGSDCGCTEENGVSYTEESYPTEEEEEAYPTEEEGYSTPEYGYSAPLAISAPSSYYSTPISSPIIPSAPIVQNVPIAYQQQQQQQQQAPVVINQPQPNVTTNTCTNYSCNTTTTISNSGNTVTTVVPVTEAPVTYPAQYTFPTNVSCTISASPNSVQAGQYSYLSWQSYGAVSATLTNYGNVAPNGSLSVQPYGSTSYVLTVYGQNGQTATCNTYVTTANITPSVTLSQIPYTGFDFGTVGDAMYWSLLALFAAAAGYLLVYYKGGMGAFAFAMVPARKTRVSKASSVVEKETTPAPAPQKVETPVVVAEVPVAKPVAPKAATLDTLPAFSDVRPTSDSMSISNHGGAPRIVINRN